MKRLVPTAAFIFVMLALVQASAAEIIVLDNGRFLRAEGFEVEGEQARIKLDEGGELILPIVRIDRVLGDEVDGSSEQELAARSLSPAEPIFLGFESDDKAPATPYGEFIFSVAQSHNVNPSLVAAIIRAESNFDPQAVSSKGARGLMQLMPSIGKRYGLVPSELFDPELNIITGVSYLEELIERYASDAPMVLAAYQAGEAAVDRHRGIPPFRETQEYLAKIYSLLGVAHVGEDPGT